MYLLYSLEYGTNKKGRRPGSGDGLKVPVLAPSSEPGKHGKDAYIDNDDDSYDDGQNNISMGISLELNAWRAHARTRPPKFRSSAKYPKA